MVGGEFPLIRLLHDYRQKVRQNRHRLDILEDPVSDFGARPDEQRCAVLFRVRDLEVRAARFDVEIAPGEIDFLYEELRQIGPLKAGGKAELVTGALGEIRVTGHLSVTMDAACDRCLEDAQFPVDADFTLYYRPVVEGYGDEKEIDSGEAEMGFYEGEGLELNDVLREQVLLALPMQRVCREDCKGICPECGQNRNQNECHCRTVSADDRWAALKQLK
jgi:uncharacterized protein